jgi:hypothetical protein
MKKSMLMLLHVFVLVSVSAWAEDKVPKAEVFGGFSILSLDAGTERIQPLGFQTSVTGNFRRNIGVVGDFGGQYKNGAHIYEYLFGPQFSVHEGRVTAFVHTLFGGVTAGNKNYSDGRFAMGFGGGLDVNANDHFAVRAIQFDWIPIHGTGEWDYKTMRFGFGIVVK